jgi:CDP-paratose 2-epimerase
VAGEARFVRLLLTGACGFVGSTLAAAWAERGAGHEVLGLDNQSRPGSEVNRLRLKRVGVRVVHGDVRLASDIDALPGVDAVVDAAANPALLAGVDGRTASRQLVEHNLAGTVNLLEYCRRHRATFILLSTSRVYSIPRLASLRLRVEKGAFEPEEKEWPEGLGREGVRETFSTEPPVSLYGATKLASERLALEYGEAFGFPVWIDRCGVVAGAGQFGRPDQGIFAYWINSWLRGAPLSYLGFDGRGHQVRDCLHPADLVPLLDRQLTCRERDKPRLVNVGGGRESAMSLRQLSAWCRERMGERPVAEAVESRPFDVPWLVLDAGLARAAWRWAPSRTTATILEEILEHARAHPDWLDLSAAG